MKKKIRIGVKTPYPLYIPKELAEDEGFKGDTYLLSNAVTATIVKPGTTLKDIKKSLQMIIDDVEFRIERGEEIFAENDEKENKSEEKEEDSEKTEAHEPDK